MYSHTQVGWIILIVLVGALVAVGAAATGQGAALIALVLLVLMFPLLGSLTVTVDEEAVTAKFGIGLIRKSIAIKDIQSATPVRNKWYYGWGIRMGPGGWMYNVSGLDAVEIAMKNGGKFRIGTDEAEELARAISIVTSNT